MANSKEQISQEITEALDIYEVSGDFPNSVLGLILEQNEDRYWSAWCALALDEIAQRENNGESQYSPKGLARLETLADKRLSKF